MGRTFVALLRGINVGGRNRVLMADLRACFDDAGCEDARTYIQSGNVVFRSDEPDRERLRHALEQALARAFDYDAAVELRDRAELQAVIDQAPAGFGSDLVRHRYDVIFLLPPLTPDQALEALTLRDGVDAAWPGPAVVYTTRVVALAAKSRLSRIASNPAYKRMTIRDWTTTIRLLAMMAED